MNRIGFAIFSLALFGLAQNSQAANRYWVGGSGEWSDAANHWAAESGGKPDSGYLPTSADKVIFDRHSGRNIDCVLDEAVEIESLSLSGANIQSFLFTADRLAVKNDLDLSLVPLSLISETGDINLEVANGDIRLPELISAPRGNVSVKALEGTIHSHGTILADKEKGIILFKAAELKLGGNYEASFIDLDPANIWIDNAVNASGDISFAATNDIYVNANVFTTSGDITFEADSDSNGAGSFIQAPGTEVKTTNSGTIKIDCAEATVYKLTSAAGVEIYQNYSGMPGNINLLDTVSANSSVRLYSNASIDIQADISTTSSVYIYADYDENGSGDLSLTNGLTLTNGVGTSYLIKAANALSLNGTALTVGGNTVTLAGGHVLSLISTGPSGTVTVAGALSSTTGVDIISYDGGVDLQASVSTSANNLTINADYDSDGTGDLTITNGITLTPEANKSHIIKAANALSISGSTLTVGGNAATLSGGYGLTLTSTGAGGTVTVTGAVSKAGTIQLYSYDGGINLQANVTATTYNLYIKADYDNDGTGDLTVTNGRTLTVSGLYTHEIQAANALSISGSTLTVGGNSVTLSGGTTTNLTSTGPSGTVTVTGAVSETNAYRIYSYDGGINLQANVSAVGELVINADADNDGTGDLTLTSGRTLTSSGASWFHNIQAANALSISGTTLTVGGVNATLSGGNRLYLTSTGPSGSVTVTGAVTENGLITLNSNDGGINLQADVSSVGSSLTINSDYDNDGTGDLTITNGRTLTAGGGLYHTIQAANALSLSDTTLTVGGNTATLSGGNGLILTSTGGSGTITVTGAVSKAGNIHLYSYDGGVNLQADVSSTGGAIYIHADYDADGTGDLTLTNGTKLTANASSVHEIKAANALSIGGTTLTAGGNTATLSGGNILTLTSTGASGTITVTGAVSKRSSISLYSYDGGVDIQADVSSSGSWVKINADYDNDGNGNLTQTAGTISGSAVYLYGNDVSVGTVSTNYSNSSLQVYAIGNITSSVNSFDSGYVVLSSSSGSIGTAGDPMLLGDDINVDASAPAGSVHLSRSGGEMTIANASEADGVQEIGIVVAATDDYGEYGDQLQNVGDNVVYKTSEGLTLKTDGNFGVDAGVVFNSANSTIEMTGNSSANRTFIGNDHTFNIVEFSNTGTGVIAVTGSNTASFRFNPGARVQFPSGATQTVTGFSGNGTSGSPVYLTASTPGLPALLSRSFGTIIMDYFSIQDSTATGGVGWYAGKNSTDLGGNTGWIFEDYQGVFYSVGQSAADLKTGSPTITIATGVATFSVAQTGNIGVGDRITYNTNTKAYIYGKISNTQWKVMTAMGARPADVSGQTVDSINRTFTSLSAAEAGASGANYLTSSDLVAGNYILKIPCYYDNDADSTAVEVNGWTTGANNYIKIYTPNNTSAEVNISQRHTGKWDDEKYRLESAEAASHILHANEEYIWIDGIQIRFINDSNPNYAFGLYFQGNGASEFKASNNIIRGTENSSGYLIGLVAGYNSGSGISKIWNNIIYGFTSTGSGNSEAFEQEDSDFTSYFYNNTIYGNQYGIFNHFGTAILKNNLAYGNTDNYYGVFDISSTNNLSGPGTDAQTPVTNKQDGVMVNFADAANADLHLTLTDMGARDAGADLGADPNLPFFEDIDGQGRAGTWEIGADEVQTAEINTSQTDKLTDGLVLMQSFDGSDMDWSQATAEARDTSSNANHGDVSGATPVIGKRGSALEFDGATSYVDNGSGASLDDLSALTISLWAKADGYGEVGQGYFIAKYAPGFIGWRFQKLSSGSKVKFGVSYQGATILSVETADNTLTSSDFGQWIHWTVTWDGSPNYSGVHIYKNGSELAYGTRSNGEGNRSSDGLGSLVIGNRTSATGGRTFDGLIDEARVYNRVLSADEIGYLYTLGQEEINMSLTDKNTSGLVGLWSFDGADMNWADTTSEAKDRSGNNNHGDVSGATPVIGMRGSALAFDGTDDQISIPDTNNSLDGVSQITLSAWFYPTATSNNWHLIAGKGTDGYNYSLWMDNYYFVATFSSGSWRNHYTNSTYALNQWYHLVMVVDNINDDVRIYVNGVDDTASSAETADMITNNGSFFVSPDYGGHRPAGKIDEVRVYNRVLSASEIGDLYRMGQTKVMR